MQNSSFYKRKDVSEMLRSHRKSDSEPKSSCAAPILSKFRDCQLRFKDESKRGLESESLDLNPSFSILYLYGVSKVSVFSSTLSVTVLRNIDQKF